MRRGAYGCGVQRHAKRPGRRYEGRKSQALGRQGEGMNLIGVRLRAARLSQDPQWSQEDLSEALGQQVGLELSAGTLSKIELGQRSVYDYELKAFCQVLNVEPRWLLDF